MINAKEYKAKEIENAITALMERIRDINTDMEEINSVENAIAALVKSIEKHRYNIENKNAMIRSLEEEADLLKSRQRQLVHTDDRAMMLEGIKNAIDGLESTKDELTNSKKSHDVAYDLLKDSGIKARIIENYLPVINSQINQHLRDLDFYVKIELDETFNESIKSRNLDDFTYDSFSEGEKARIDLALLFTWRRIAEMKNSVNTNLLILDEVFDGSLDALGADEVMTKLLFNRAVGSDGEVYETNNAHSNIYVISHKVELVDKFENTIKFEKVRGFSTIKAVTAA
jgi:DNA repair exonuclease SbcCD ATPase subunit